VFTARYGLIPYIKHITFRLLKVNLVSTNTFVYVEFVSVRLISESIDFSVMKTETQKPNLQGFHILGLRVGGLNVSFYFQDIRHILAKMTLYSINVCVC